MSNESASRVSTLRSLLEAYNATAVEAEDLIAILELIDTGPDTLAADHYVPGHVTASAFVIDKSHSRLLLIHHGKLDRWLQPGGHVDDGEDVLTAAVREVLEETGVTGVPIREGIFDVDVHPIPAHGNTPAHDHFDVRFLLEATSEDLADSDEVLGVRWVPFEDVGVIVTDPSVLRATGKLRRPSVTEG
jgi:8-oxo-dGTP pyrophosphatase MutT (NUDIX family)